MDWARRACDVEFPPAFYDLAYCLEYCIGTTANLVSALNCYERSAKAGYGLAAFRLGKAYADGDLLPRDPHFALQYMELANDLGASLAALELAQWYEDGGIVAQDNTKAIYWYERASSEGECLATHRLQVAYGMGQLGVRKDPRREIECRELYESQSRS